MAPRTQFEQLALEIINRARLDPAAEAARFGIALNEGLAAGTITTDAKQVLSGNSLLVNAARGHSQHMLNVDLFDHLGIGDGDPGTRVTAAGYTAFSRLGENIAVTSGTDQAVTTAQLHQLLFVDSGVAGRGHRTNLLDPNFREIGLGQLTGNFIFSGGGAFNSTMLTQDFGTRGANIFITGATYNDTDNDSFYDLGEARGGVSVTVTRNAVQTAAVASEAAGGYDASVATLDGSIVRFSGGGLAAPVQVTLTGAQQNAKVDLVGTNKIFSSANVTLGTGALNLKLLGIAALNGTGNSDNNTIEGNRGANVLTGGAGNDKYLIGAGDSIVEAAGAGGGNDTIQTADISINLASFAHVENVTLTGTLALTATGNAADNQLIGQANGAANVLTGAGGNDTYTVGTGDTVVEAAGAAGGTDTVLSTTINLNLANFANVENITLVGALALTGTGNGQNNIFNGQSSSAANVLTGGGGNDSFVVGTGDTVVEAAGAAGGTDAVVSTTISLNLANFANVENVTLSGALLLNATGNGGGNLFVSTLNTAANVLTGLNGDDVYVVGVGDTIVEQSGVGSGADILITDRFNVNLANFANVESVILTGAGGLSATGTSIANGLNGEASAGANTLTGLQGDDTYTIGTGDSIVEQFDAVPLGPNGFDTVQSSTVSINLVNFANVEVARLSGTLGLSLSGGAASDDLIGNSAANAMFGGGGADDFIFSTALNGTFDTIGDFTAGLDDIQLDDDIFIGLTGGVALAGTQFRSGAGVTAANSIDQRIIYNTSTGDAFFDQDGSGGTFAAIRFASLSNLAALGTGDFEVIV